METRTQIKKRICCDVCGEKATKKHSLLFENARTNPASSGYGGDDISWCSDKDVFSCDNGEHEREAKEIDGYNWCSTFPYERFEHMFFEWVTAE